jgi:hypothetical protein
MLDASTLERNSEYQPQKELWLQNIEGGKNQVTLFPIILYLSLAYAKIW